MSDRVRPPNDKQSCVTDAENGSILKEIGKGERVALSRLAIEHFERTNRPFRVAVDAAIWNFQTQSGQGGKNPALRTLFFRLLRLLSLPIQPVFVYDGKDKPRTKRGRTVVRYGSSVENEMAKELLAELKFPAHTAPGEAEAECAMLQKMGIVDAVMSQDVDAIMFGSNMTLRDWSKEGTRGNKMPTHVDVMHLTGIKERAGLDPDGMVLVALLSGGDYNEAGVPGFGPTLACEIARAGFGTDLLDMYRRSEMDGLVEWRERLEFELQTNESGYFRKRHPRLGISAEFPDETIMGYYTNPVVSTEGTLTQLQSRLHKEWDTTIDVVSLREYTARTFDWNWKSGATRLIRCFAQPMLQARLTRGAIPSFRFTSDSILDSRKHFYNDGIVELRVEVVPANVAGVDLSIEEHDPDGTDERAACQDHESEGKESSVDLPDDIGLISATASRKSIPWDATRPEKWWIPETLLQVGYSAAIEEWQQKQRDVQADPKRFAKRKAANAKRPATIDLSTGKQSLIGIYLHHDDARKARPMKASSGSRCPPPHSTDPSNIRKIATSKEVPATITQFFKPRKPKTALVSASSSPAAPSRGVNTFTTPCHPEPAHHLGTSLDSECGSSHLDEVGNQTLAETVNVDDGMSNVTLRQKSPCKKPRSRSIIPVNHQHHRAGLAEEVLPDGTSDSPESRDPTHSVHDSSSQRGDVTGAPDRHIYAVSRGSLPGTWKSIALDEVTSSRPPRVSHVDLTDE